MSNAYQPSLASAQKALGAVPVVRKDYPGGAKGVHFSLEEMARRIRDGRNDPYIRAFAGKTITAAGARDKGVRAQTQALLDRVRKEVMYAPDPVGTEMIVSPRHTLCLDENSLCIKIGDCFAEGTLLLRDDFTFVPVQEIKEGDRIWGRNQWTTVRATSFKGNLPVDAVVMNNGSVINLTEDHWMYVAECEEHKHLVTPCQCDPETRTTVKVRVKDLKPKMVLVQPKQIAFGSENMDPDRAYLEGLFVSDGWADKETEFSISGQDGCPKEDQKKEVQAICQRLGIETRWHRKSIAVKDKAWAQRVHRMGHGAPNKHLLSINMGEAAAAQTLRGVMADSGKNTNGLGRTFTTTSYRLLVQTRVLHRMFGKSCGYRFIEKHGGLGKNPIWRLGVRAPSEHIEKILRVKCVEKDVDIVPCYDIQTEDHYVYLPEHDVTVSNCDDLVVALSSLTLSVGIPTQIIGQSFDASGVPSHVLLAVRDGNAWLKADPSTKLDVGRAHTATKEVWVDPLEEHLSQLEGAGAAGDFVGIGHVGVGDLLTDAQKKAMFDTATAQVKVAIFLLTKSTNDLAAALTTIDQTRRALRPNNPYDPEPANPIDNFLALPSGVWTQNEANLAMGLYNTCATVARAGNQALDGSRRILLDADANEIFLEIITGDPFSLRHVFKNATDDVIAIFQPPSAPAPTSGFTAKGKVLTGKQVEDSVDVLKTGVGAAPLVILGVAAAIALTSIAICYVLIRQAEATKSAAYEATYQSVLQALAQGKMTPDQANAVLATIGKNQIAIQNAEVANKKADPFASTVDSISSIVKWSVLGAVVVGGAYLAAPLLKETIHDFRANRMRALRK